MNRILSFATATATAFSLAFTPAPAAADAEDVAAAIAGIAVLGLIAKSVNDKRDDRKEARRHAVTQQQPFYHNQRHSNLGHSRIIEGEIIRNRGVANRNGLRNIKRITLPRRCVRQLRTRNGLRPVYGERCLENRFSFASSLPQHCERLVNTRNGVRTFFSRRCLARDGWNVSLN